MTVLSTPSLYISKEPGVFTLATPMRYGWAAKLVVLNIPAGTKTDFASIPRPFRNIFNINGRHRVPAILHDYLYGCAGKVVTSESFSMSGNTAKLETPMIVSYTRSDADLAFYRAMREHGVGKTKAVIMFRAVRIFGGLHVAASGGKTWGR